jgi:hypothetical protein
MFRYVIERDLPGVGSLSDAQIREASQASGKALADIGQGIQWVRSHVTADRIYCEYLASSENVVLDHARRAGLPANRVSEVKRVIDPLTANAR